MFLHSRKQSVQGGAGGSWSGVSASDCPVCHYQDRMAENQTQEAKVY